MSRRIPLELPGTQLSQTRCGANEARFRSYTDSLAHFVEEIGDPGDLEFECECGHPRCRAHVRMHVDHYRLLRQRPVFMIGHRPLTRHRVIWNHGTFHVVTRARERRHGVVRLGMMVHCLMTERLNPFATPFVGAIDPDRDYYVQFARQGDCLFFEAVHNKYLEGGRGLSEEQHGALIRLGFSPPGTPDQNWFRELQPASRRECVDLAELAFRALEEVYGMRRGRAPQLVPWWEAPELPEESDSLNLEETDD